MFGHPFFFSDTSVADLCCKYATMPGGDKQRFLTGRHERQRWKYKDSKNRYQKALCPQILPCLVPTAVKHLNIIEKFYLIRIL